MEIIGALVGMIIMYLNYPDASVLGYILGAISGGMVVSLWKKHT
jgi:zinc transporter ZupT|tara:strand:- start:227 stop:358 length:132 start_codon:yes stop_codon:yes gene_type:complete